MQNWPNFGYQVNYVVSQVGLSPSVGSLALSGFAPSVSQGGVLTGLWSDPATWGGSVPTSTDAVVISSGQTVYLDTASAVALSVDVQGTLRSLPTPVANIALTTGNINIGSAGVLQIGTEASPFPSTFTATITLNGAEVGRTARTVLGTSLGFTNNGVGRSIQVQPGGTLTMIGVAPTFKRTKLNAHAAAGTNTFTLADTTGWLAGDDIVMGTTDFFGVSVPEKLTLTANASGTSIQTTTTIASARWGLLQYITDSGMSLSNTGLTGTPGSSGTAAAPSVVVDERAMVINLRRNIIVQGANDTAWSSNKFGVHMMFMSSGTTTANLVQPNVKLDGVRMIRCGQAGALGRYPIHWHMCSYRMDGAFTTPSATGTFIGALTNNYAKNCAIEQSGQRMITIHGTHGITLDANVGFDITGHALFLEDGSEMNNTITNNVVMKVRAPTSGNKLLNHDVAAPDYSFAFPGQRQPQGVAGVWFTNANNTLQGNWVNDSEGAGIWNSFATQCFGLSINVTSVVPNNLPVLVWADNVCIGNQGAAAATNFPVINDKGDTVDSRFDGNDIAKPMKTLWSFKNAGGGYSNRVNSARYENFVLADNAGIDVYGQASLEVSVGAGFVSIAETLNNSTSRYTSSKRSAFATYHELLNFKNTIVVGYGWQDGVFVNDGSSPIGGGIFRLWDLYIKGMFSFIEETGIKQVNCAVPYRPLPPDLDGNPLSVASHPGQFRNWSLAGAIRDENGVFVPAGNTWIYDKPFLTYGLTTSTPVAPSGSNGVYTPDRFYGVGTNWYCDFANNTTTGHPFYEAIRVAQQDTSGTEQGVWNVGDGNVSLQLNGMRHFAARDGGRYRLSFPGSLATSYVSFNVSGMTGTNDIFLMGVEFSGSVTVTAVWEIVFNQFFTTASVPNAPDSGNITAGRARVLTSTGSLANVVADTTGTIFFQETSTNTVWFKVKVGSLAQNLSTTFLGGDPLKVYYRDVQITVKA